MKLFKNTYTSQKVISFLMITGFVLGSIHSARAMEDEGPSYKPLEPTGRPICGTPKYIEAYERNGELTSGRVFDSSSTDLRTRISAAENKGSFEEVKKFGESLGHLGYIHFRILKTLEGPESGYTCYKYAFSTFGAQLEQLANKPMLEILRTSPEWNMKQYFECVNGEPQDGDLVVYQREETESYGKTNRIVPLNTHAGIFRYTPRGGVVESKWECRSLDVFQHEVFFVPESDGNIVKFYRLKKKST